MKYLEMNNTNVLFHRSTIFKVYLLIYTLSYQIYPKRRIASLTTTGNSVFIMTHISNNRDNKSFGCFAIMSQQL